MKRDDMHINGRQLILLLSGQLSPDEERSAKEHILHCEECRREYDMLSMDISSREPAVVPSARVREGILSAWDNAAERRPRKRLSNVFRIPALAATAAVIGGVVFAAYLLISPSLERRKSVFAISDIRGDVLVDGVPVRDKEFLPYRTKIITGDNSGAVVGHDGFTIRIFPSSVLVVTSAEDGSRLSGSIEKGRIVSSSTGYSSYSYTATGYTITPKGTIFSVSVNDSDVSVDVNSGRVSVTDASGKECAVIEAGNKWISSNTSSVSSMSAEDQSRFSEAVVKDKTKPVQTPSRDIEQNPVSMVEVPDNTAKEESRQQEREELRKERSDLDKDRSDIKAEQKEMKKMRRKGRENP